MEELDEFVDDYLLEQRQVEEFKKRDELGDSLIGAASFLILFSLVLLIVNITGSIESDIFLGFSSMEVAIGGIVVATILVLISYILRSPISDMGLSRKDILFHYFATTIQYYHEDDDEGTYENLTDLADYLERHDFNFISPTNEKILEDYVDSLSSIDTDKQRSEIIMDTFDDIVIPILNRILDNNKTDKRTIINEIENKTQQEATITWGQIFISSIRKYISAENIREAAPYVFVAAAGLVVFHYVNPQLGMFVVIVGLPFIQQFVQSGEEEE